MAVLAYHCDNVPYELVDQVADRLENVEWLAFDAFADLGRDVGVGHDRREPLTKVEEGNGRKSFGKTGIKNGENRTVRALRRRRGVPGGGEARPR